ncbi:MAG: hypothetical protein H3C30_14370 [Candidatus Hydrogenedentes bacterium]|nr:hypothetical protein [Candidatus Hydrogenedentota bacterium]
MTAKNAGNAKREERKVKRGGVATKGIEDTENEERTEGTEGTEGRKGKKGWEGRGYWGPVVFAPTPVGKWLYHWEAMS